MTEQFHLPGLAPVPRAVPTATTCLTPAHDTGLPLPLLFSYPQVSGPMRSRHAKSLGRAGESLFDSLMFRLGLESFAPGENLGFDRVMAVDSPVHGLTNLARVQIKTVTEAEGGFYRFTMSCGYRKSPQGRRAYQGGAFDIAALVILPRNAIFFTAEKRPQHQIHLTEVARLQDDPQESLLRALRQVRAARGAQEEACRAPGECDSASAAL